MSFLMCAVFYWLFCIGDSMQPSTLHALLLCACLHFTSLKVKLICSIITHLSKLLSRCQHNLPPSALMAAQLWMVDGYLIEETTSHWAQEEDDWEKEQKITSPVCLVPIYSLIWESVEKWCHLWKLSCSLKTRLQRPRHLLTKAWGSLSYWSVVRSKSNNMLLKTDNIDTRSTTSDAPIPTRQRTGIILYSFFNSGSQSHFVWDTTTSAMCPSWRSDALFWPRFFGSMSRQYETAHNKLSWHTVKIQNYKISAAWMS